MNKAEQNGSIRGGRTHSARQRAAEQSTHGSPVIDNKLATTMAAKTLHDKPDLAQRIQDLPQELLDMIKLLHSDSKQRHRTPDRLQLLSALAVKCESMFQGVYRASILQQCHLRIRARKKINRLPDASVPTQWLMSLSPDHFAMIKEICISLQWKYSLLALTDMLDSTP